MRIVDPWGNKVDLSGFLGREEKETPRCALRGDSTETPERTAEFYQSVFELRKIGKASDGSVRLNVGFCPWL
jgi:hypothetical protein